MRNKKISKTTNILMKASWRLQTENRTNAKGKIKKAAESGDECAQFILGMMSKREDPIPVPEEMAALAWFNRTYQPDQSAVVDDPLIAINALAFFKKAAAQKNVDAQYRLGVIYAVGSPIALPNKPEAINLLQQAAQKGHAEAQYCLARLCEGEEALEWFTKAALNNHKDAQFTLGQKYQEGHGVEKSEVQALNWLSKAVEGEHRGAKLYLGSLIEKAIPPNRLYPEIYTLIDVIQNVLGEHYNVLEMFRALLMEGNLGLKEELSVYVTALQSVKSKVKKESNEWKSICFSLVEPIWTLFLFNIQQIEPLVIYKSLLESQKPRILNALSRLQEPVKKILQVEHRRMREDMSWGAGAEELLSATIQHIEDTCDLNNIIRYLVEIIPLIGKVALALDSPKMSPSPGACTSSGLSNQMQSLQGDDKPSLVLGLLSPRRAGGKPGLMPCLLSPKRSNRKCDGIPDLPLDGRESLLISPRLNASNAAHASIRGKREKSLKQPSFFSNNNSVDDNDNREHLSSSLQLTSGL